MWQNPLSWLERMSRMWNVTATEGGIFAVVCGSRQQVQEVFEQQDIQEDSLYLGEVKDHNTGWYTDITLNGENISFKIDTRAAVTAIPTKLYDYRMDGTFGKYLWRKSAENSQHLLYHLADSALTSYSSASTQVQNTSRDTCLSS